MIESSEVTASRGVVAANPAAAARIGATVLGEGGNAFDAAVAAAVACCVLEPNQTGIGGYVAVAVVREGKTGRVWSLDANAVAPAAAQERMFEVLPPSARWPLQLNENEYGCSVADNANVHGPRAVATPGLVAGLGTLHERWGRHPWAGLLEPSIALIEEGFRYANVVGVIRQHLETLKRFPETAKHLMPAGRLPGPDDAWRPRDLAGTLRRLASAGWRDFYTGELGRTLADWLQAAGGIVTREDLARYQVRITEPHEIGFHGARIATAILPNGGLTSLQALHMFEALDLPAEDSPEYWHLLGEVLKLAWRDRLEHLADPNFSPVPVERLLSRDYAAGRVQTLRQFPGHVDRLQPADAGRDRHGTLHLSTADAEGNLVALTISQGAAFGSFVTVPGMGVILGHGMCRLDPRPGRANSIAPGKRPLNNTAGMIVQCPRCIAALGVPGGRTIISVMARAAQRLVSQGHTARQVATAPRLHVEVAEPLEITASAGAEVIEALQAMGHTVKVVERIGTTMNGAEWLIDEQRCRAGSGVTVAGVD